MKLFEIVGDVLGVAVLFGGGYAMLMFGYMWGL
jgi:hypothetical protein